MNNYFRIFFLLVFFTVVAAIIALPKEIQFHFQKTDFTIRRPDVNFTFLGQQISTNLDLKQGLDIQGGMQVVLRADMANIASADRKTALDSAKEVIQRRVDLYGVSEPVVQTSIVGNEYRIIVELAGVQNPDQALQLIGTTAQLDFRLQNASVSAAATTSALAFFQQFSETGLTGKHLQRSAVQFYQQTGEPIVSME